MRVLLVGAGAVGQYLAARLRLGGHEAVLLARGKTALLLAAHGIRLRAGGREWPVRVEVANDPGAPILAKPFELAIVATKSWATREAADAIASAQGCSQASVMTVQNGLGNEEALAVAFGAERTIAAALTTAVERLDPTTVLASNRGGLSIAPLGATPHNWIMAALQGTGLRVSAAGDWRALKWSKLCINLIANAVCAVLDWKPAQVYADQTAFSIERRCLVEAVDVMRKLELAPVGLVDFPVPLLVHAVRSLPAPVLRLVLASRVARARNEKLPSLLLDLRAGRTQLEVGALNGAVAERARAAGSRAPANEAVTRVLSGIAAHYIDWSEYRSKPDKLQETIDREARRDAIGREAQT